MFKNMVMGALLSFTVIPGIVFSQEGPDRGRDLYALKCGRCHNAYNPKKYSVEEWKTILKEMGPLAGLNGETEKVILDYLGQDRKEAGKKDFPTSPVLAGYLYTEYFSGPDRVDTFDMHYLNVNLSGRLHDRISYRAEFEFEHGGGQSEPPFIEQAYMDVWLTHSLGVKIGAILTPFNRFDEFHGPLENDLVNRPQISREIGVSAWKDVGLNLHGKMGLGKSFFLNFDAYAINGLGAGNRLRNSRQYLDNNDAKSLGFRLSGVAFDRLEAGISYYQGAWDKDGAYDLTLLGIHVLGRWANFNLFAEYAKALSENPEPYEKGKADGYFFQLSYLWKSKLRPTVRLGTLDYLDPGMLLGRTATDFDEKIVGLGLNYYLSRAIVFKMEYDFVLEGKRITKKDNNLLSAQAAIRF